MESNTPNTFVNSYEDGVERVLNGSYAFLCESTMLDYLIQRNCNLTQIGGLLDSKGYGIATPKGSKWRDKISQSILFLQEKGTIQVWENDISRTYNFTIKRNPLYPYCMSKLYARYLNCISSEDKAFIRYHDYYSISGKPR